MPHSWKKQRTWLIYFNSKLSQLFNWACVLRSKLPKTLADSPNSFNKPKVIQYQLDTYNFLCTHLFSPKMHLCLFYFVYYVCHGGLLILRFWQRKTMASLKCQYFAAAGRSQKPNWNVSLGLIAPLVASFDTLVACKEHLSECKRETYLMTNSKLWLFWQMYRSFRGIYLPERKQLLQQIPS